MTIDLIALPPENVEFDEARFPDLDRSLVFDHLLHVLSLSEILPAIELYVDEQGMFVTRGHQYLRVARDLGRPTIRAVVDLRSDQVARAALHARSDVTDLDWAEIDALERSTPIVASWQVFYFERPLSVEEKGTFDRDIAGFFERHDFDRGYPITHDDSGPLAEFQVLAPVADERWYPGYLAAIHRFDSEVVRIVSYQGGRFGG